MKISLHAGPAWVAGLALAASAAAAEMRMQVSAKSTPVYAQPSGAAQPLCRVSSGEILFVSRVEGDWAAVSPPERLDLWLNKDFIEGNRVIAKSIQVRAGPGIQFDVVGTLERGAPVMPRGEDGDWCKIAPPSSATLWVKKSDLSEVRVQTTPIREVATVAKPAPLPSSTAAPMETPAAMPAPAPAAAPAPAVPVPAPVAAAAAPAPVVPKVQAPPPPTARPAVPVPVQAPVPAPVAKPVPPAAPPVRRPPDMPAISKAVPAPAGAVVAQKSKDLDVQVDPQFVEDLDLAEGVPNQGKAVQVEGELRNAPFMGASPSRFRLIGKDEDGLLEMVCHIHGDSKTLRPYVGKGVSIRGREYWVDASDMPVVVVGQIVPLAPASEPVMF